jgi:hypothetical protein
MIAGVEDFPLSSASAVIADAVIINATRTANRLAQRPMFSSSVAVA